MTDFLIIVLLSTSFLGLIILVPLFIIKAKASMYSAKITLGNAWTLYLRKSARKKIFQALSIAQRNNLPITLDQVQSHWFAGGDPTQIVELMTHHSKDKEITFRNLSLIELAGKNVEQAIEQSTITHTIELNDYELRSFKLNYHAKFKLGVLSVFGNQSASNIETKIIDKLQVFAFTWNSNDLIDTKSQLETTILSTEFWKQNLNAQLIDHNLSIRN